MTATEKKSDKPSKRPLYDDVMKKKAISLFDEGKSPKVIVEELKTFFKGQRTAKVKCIRRWVRKSGRKINGK